jgi:hypothetical protein
MNKEVGDLIFFEINGTFYIDRIKELVEIDGKILVTPSDCDWLALREEDLLDENDIRVKEYNALHKDAFIKLSDARRWLQYHLIDYYESDSWSSFDDEQAVKDFCIAMLNE